MLAARYPVVSRRSAPGSRRHRIRRDQDHRCGRMRWFRRQFLGGVSWLYGILSHNTALASGPRAEAQGHRRLGGRDCLHVGRRVAGDKKRERPTRSAASHWLGPAPDTAGERWGRAQSLPPGMVPALARRRRELADGLRRPGGLASSRSREDPATIGLRRGFERKSPARGGAHGRQVGEWSWLKVRASSAGSARR